MLFFKKKMKCYREIMMKCLMFSFILYVGISVIYLIPDQIN